MTIQAFRIKIKTDTRNIDFLNRVFEGYDRLATVSTLDVAEGIVKIWGYGKTGPVKRVLKGLPFKVELLTEEIYES